MLCGKVYGAAPPSSMRTRPPTEKWYCVGGAYFTLKGTQTKRSATRVRNNPQKKHEAKGDAPGLKSSDVSLDCGSEGPNQAESKITWETFSCSTPTFFLASASQRKRQCSCLFFWVVFMIFFFPQLFFFISEGFQWGCFWGSKFQNLRAIS